MYQINEGRFTVPAGFEDKSTTVLQGVGGDKQLSLTVIRDVLEENEGINEYVVRQLGELKKRLPGYKMLDKKTAFLGDAKTAIEGIQIESRYKYNKSEVFQRQAGFIVNDKKVLVLTLTRSLPFEEQAELCWQDLLSGFELRT
ncbi:MULTISPECIES: DcrB-related protein [Serratia]|uniref:DcrB-related protein n=1 Tax=Serratia TaxID=613 RepID=UPI00080FD85F|nr:MULTISPECIES: DcrB-related protein [Serratia]MBC3228585.1 DUF1795 domain-containing protein [Serratia fonticola]OCJ30500.1 hypothetical protein A6U95_06220 [Serratia sp. 14-2641]